VHAAYDPDYANRLWRILLQADRVLKTFRARFGGKSSPVHFFWGSFDLAVTRFSGRPAPLHPGGVPNLPDWSRVTPIPTRSAAPVSGRWWCVPYPAFYSYAYPEPPGFKDARVRPESAFYSDALREFFLPYDAVRQAESPDDMLLEFFQSTYEAAATLGGWTGRRSSVRFPQPAGQPDMSSDRRRRNRWPATTFVNISKAFTISNSRSTPNVRVREDRRYLGSPAYLSDLWRDPLLRLLAESACQKTCQHFRHPVISSAEPGERWLYCFPDQMTVNY